MTMTRYYIYYVLFLIATWNSSLAAGTKCPKPELISPCRCLMKRDERQVWCSHSDLPSVLSGLRSLSKHINSPIDELILENNYLPSLPGRTFSNLKVLRIMLRQNGLERVSPDWLHELEDVLLELFIVEPKLRYLPDDSLSRMNSLEAITIQTNELKRLPQISSLMKLRYLQVESVALDELSPRNFKNLPILEKFHISGSKNLKRLDAGLFEDMPLLKSINVSHCGISWIHPRAFSNLPELKSLSLTNNDIREARMVGRACKDIQFLKELVLDYNKIDKLTKGSFVDLPSLRNLHLSFNNVLEIHQAAFHRVPRLRVLNLSNNMVKKIHPESFIHESNSGVEELWIIHNDISQISELRSIFNALPSLIYLDMSFNKLERISFGSLGGHPTLEVLKLNSNRIHQIDKEAFMAMPALRELSLRNNSLTNYNLEPLWNLPSLKGLDLSQNKYRKFDRTFLANLPSLRRLDASSNELVTIDPIALSQTYLIEFVNMSDNNLQFIHPATFKHLEKLYELDISQNNIEEFLVELPEGLEYLHLHSNKLRILPFISGSRKLYSLKHLDLSYNFISKMNSFHLKKLPSLKKLYLTHNFIQHLEEGALDGLSKLEILDFSVNKIVSIHPSIFKNLHNLIELNLRNNFVDTIFSGLIQKVPKLTKLDVSANKLVDFIQEDLEFNPSIKYLNISNNFLLDMPKNIFKLKYIMTLDLSHNRIKNLPVEAFSKLEHLVDLRISNNFIRELRLSTFSKLRHLRILHLDHNTIDKIETNTFQSLPNLEIIKLDENKLSTIPSYTFNNLTMLHVAELQSNNLEIVASDAFNLVPNLVFLNISRNNIKSIEESGLRNAPSLEVLDLSNNAIRTVDSDSFKQMEWLVEIKLDQNNICAIFGTPFRNMPRLRVISMRRNKLKKVFESLLEGIRTNIAVFDVDENPLLCDCNIFWLQIWAEESSIMGPHCIDGNLVREMKLSPSYCKQMPIKEKYYDDCDDSRNEFSQTFSHFPLPRNISGEDKSNILAPLPQESEYFYDEYVDYPFNESSLMDSKVKDGILDRFLKINHSSIMMPQLSSHVIPGDTPTLYAASSKNKDKPDLPKVVPYSPSSSGFTFFGVPLPSLSLNQLLGGNNKKNGAKTVQKSVLPVADRKIAIMNNPDLRGTIARNIWGKPPNPPFIETGGFRPILPGEAGFRPMLETTTIITDLPGYQLSTEFIGFTQKVLPISEKEEKHQENSTDSLNSGSSAIIRRAPSQPDSATSSTQFETTEQYFDESTTYSSTEDLRFGSVLPTLPTINIKELDPISQSPIQLNPIEIKEHASRNSSLNITEDMENTPAIPMQYILRNTSELQNNKDDVFSATETGVIEDTEIVELVSESAVSVRDNVSTINNTDLGENIDLSMQQETNTHSINSSGIEVIEISTYTPIERTQNISNISKNVRDTIELKSKTKGQTSDITARILNETRIPEPMLLMPTLLIPGGRQSDVRSAGRSTITKVQSPFTTESSSNLIKISDSKHVKQMAETVTLDPEISKLDEQKESWYFANYNKTFSEPYIGVNPNSIGRMGVSGYTVIFSVLAIIISGF